MKAQKGHFKDFFRGNYLLLRQNKSMAFLKKNWSNLLLIGFLVLLIVPQTRMPIQVLVNRLISFSPSEVSENKRITLEDYDWRLQKLNGDRVNLNQSKGRVAVINLWATWCPPCIAEMPSFQKLYNDYSDRIDFYFVTSEKEEKIEQFLVKRELDLPAFQPLQAGPENLASNTLPTTYVLSKDGRIVVSTTGAANWNDSNFRKLLDKLLKEES